jgi:hypothetical protein
MTAAIEAFAASDRARRLVVVARPHDDCEGQLIVNLLADREIKARVTGGTLACFRAETPGEVCVLVRDENAVAAREIIVDHERLRHAEAAESENWQTFDQSPAAEDATETTTTRASSFFSWIVPLCFAVFGVIHLVTIAGGLLGLWNSDFNGIEFLAVGGLLWLTALSFRHFRRPQPTPDTPPDTHTRHTQPLTVRDKSSPPRLPARPVPRPPKCASRRLARLPERAPR